jgi:Uma2 family endonuclease
MVEVGILTESDKVELLDGRIVEKMSRNPPHDSGLHRLMNALARLVPTKYLIRSQSALRLSNSVPEPDIALVRGPATRYDAQHPRAEDAVLVVEVSDSTLQDDQGEKLALYAREGILVYWVLNLVDRRLEVYSDPTGPDHFPTYRIRTDISEDGVVVVPVSGKKKLTVRVRDVLPEVR